ncbi:glutamate-5-semialdehyde dehydrogenase [Desulfosediminicola ganghwensis]|uniref:glutamate-5-semialdehyde dehydrogenase n=1 Tax=Desulfosediminicola ganghwensis TaxID=2569540 RepID=UPI0010ACA5E6|nr:glutamate-5-semialdehyde dehydrogenase [Desulfosediminicola ganghwensis]
MTDTKSLNETIITMAKAAQQASVAMMPVSSKQKDGALRRVAQLLDQNRPIIQSENEKDLLAGREKGLSKAMLDRLALTDKVIDSMIQGLQEVIALQDPVGSVDSLKLRPNGLQVGRMRVPLGVIAMIYESRPNVTIDAAALCLKTGNAVLLRGGSEAIHSNLVLAGILQQALQETGLPTDAVQVIPVTDRQAVNFLLQQEETIDLVIPRGGEGLIRFVSETSRIPVLKHYKGVCHIFVDEYADLDKATPVIVNGKTSRPGVCNALEGVLIHEAVADKYVPEIVKTLTDKGVTVKGCQKTVELCNLAEQALETDWGTEFLELTLVCRVVKDMEEACRYIHKHGSKHTEVILTENYSNANAFISHVDASAVMVNASTRFNDGGQLGLGAEIGISTTKLHAYGPMGLEELTARKFVVYGNGQVRN